MGLFRFVSKLLRIRCAPNLAFVGSQTAVETLEQRVLFAVQANTNVFDAVTPAGYAIPGAYAGQSETSNATFSMPGSSSNQVAVAYNDGAMRRYGQNANGSPMHQTGWAYSDDGGQSFSQPSTDPANPALLPTISDGTETTGDEANHVLAWDNENATLYMASTSFPNESDINVYASTDGWQTFTSVMDATPGAPTGTGNTIKYDKPWLAVDNNPGPNYGTVYLAYVQINNGTTEIFVTNLQPGPGKTWLPFSSESVLNTNGLGLVQSPEILVEPNDWVDVVFVGEGGGYGIYLDRSTSPTIQYGWNATPTRLVTFQNVTDYPFDSMDTYDATDMTGRPTIAGIPAYPSVAIGTLPYGHTYLYMAYMDQNPDALGQPNGPFSIYELQYDLTTPPQAPITPSQVGQLGSVTNEWMPSLTLSPDGSYAFIGFYGGNGDYDPVTGTADEQYNTFYITGATNAGGINWSAPTQITNVDASSGQPTGGYFDQPNGRKSGAQEWNPDYDSASADYQNFHYSFMETSNEQVHDSSGNPVTLDAQEDVYMADLPIPYVGTAPQAPIPTEFSQSSNGGVLTLTFRWDSQPYQSPSLYDARAFVEYSVAGQGWLPFGPPGSAGNGLVQYSGQYIPIPNYSSNTTYYFRLRVQYTPGPYNGDADSCSGWSSVYVAPGSSTMVFRGTSATDTIALREDDDGQNIDFTLNNVQTKVPIISGGSLLVLGEGGDDTITFDLSNGNFLAAAGNMIDNDTGSMKLDIVGTPSADTVNIVGGGNAPYQFNTTYVNVVAGLLDSLEYDDGGGAAGDTISVSGAIPVMLNLANDASTAGSTITNSDSAPVYVVPGTGKITLNATCGATIFPASTATTGVRQIDFAAINISAGAKVVLATSAALGVYSNHANRSVAVIDAGGLNVTSGGTLDMGDNDMILNYAPANRAATGAEVFDLLASGITANGDWSGTGITSSEANYDSSFGIGARAVGFMDNNDVQDTSFDGVTLPDFNQIMIKFTYYGDADLSGTFDATDVNQLIAGRSDTPGNTGWEFADFDYDGTTSSSTDQNLFFAGRNAYKTYGSL